MLETLLSYWARVRGAIRRPDLPAIKEIQTASAAPRIPDTCRYLSCKTVCHFFPLGFWAWPRLMLASDPVWLTGTPDRTSSPFWGWASWKEAFVFPILSPAITSSRSTIPTSGSFRCVPWLGPWTSPLIHSSHWWTCISSARETLNKCHSVDQHVGTTCVNLANLLHIRICHSGCCRDARELCWQRQLHRRSNRWLA